MVTVGVLTAESDIEGVLEREGVIDTEILEVAKTLGEDITEAVEIWVEEREGEEVVETEYESVGV